MYRRAVLASLLLTPATSALAQSLPSWATAPASTDAPAAGGPCGPAPCPPPPPPPVPVDGGIGLLALAGTALAAHRLRRRSRVSPSSGSASCDD